ncbi:phospho-sugar mutase [Paenibacillus koleovorans]|uniref:phospho-sugar mutase n=1 Tax=Paenibacillus koleovorans TaxID=121608 RepID=UPI000FDAF512|nr:phospho-sugar mutase [Paenibacillus koleovorans]
MSEAQARYQAWLNDEAVDAATKQELQLLEGSEREIEDRFYRDLEFGTGGLRGVIGAGTNRMNRYTVAKATQGLARFVLEQPLAAGESLHSVAIAYDSRNQSPEFSLEAALVLAGNGIRAYLFDALRTTPELSFAVRHLRATAGIVVTASHNPPEYNGYKVYGADGGQLVPASAERVLAHVQAVAGNADVLRLTAEEAVAQGLLVTVGAAVDEAYIDAVTSVSLNADVVRAVSDEFSIVYTPLHGAGNLSVRAALARIGFRHVHVVPEQELPDAGFSTVRSPNPEEREAFTLAIELAKQEHADLIIGTDPDCDRVGAVVKNSAGEYVVLTGNQSGALLTHYLLSSLKAKGQLPPNGVVIKTIVTSEMGAVIAQAYGVSTLNTLTGFKYIGAKMTEFEQTGEKRFLFGYEESYGYLAGTYARDKDAVLASMLLCEAAAYYKSQGQTLYEVLEELYRTYGTFLEALESRTMKGIDGVAAIRGIMADWRNHPPEMVGGVPVAAVQDYSLGIDDLPQENVLKFTLADDSWFCLRPSGTEPKIKVYFSVCGGTPDQASEQLNRLRTAVMERVDG